MRLPFPGGQLSGNFKGEKLPWHNKFLLSNLLMNWAKRSSIHCLRPEGFAQPADYRKPPAFQNALDCLDRAQRSRARPGPASSR